MISSPTSDDDATMPDPDPDPDRPRRPLEPEWASVYRTESVRLIRLATALVGAADAHDLVVDTVHRVVQRQNWSTITEPGAYLTRALLNSAMAARRSDGRRQAREQRAGRLRIVRVADEAIGMDVRSALRRLTVQQRAIAFLTYWEDLSIPDVARRLDVTEGTVRKQLARAKDRLREVLQ